MIRLTPLALLCLTLRRFIFIPLLLFSLSIVFVLLIWPMTQHGMSLDGIVYAAIAKNMAIGRGTVWDPFYSQTIWPHFYEHPSLAFFLQSLYFKVLGQHFLVERAYALTMAILQFGLLSWLWLSGENHRKHSVAWLLLLWILVPLNVLAYKHNYIEGTATFFSTLGAVILIRFDTPHFLKQALVLWLAGGCILLGFLSNGPVYVFPLIIPLLQAFCLKKKTVYKALIQTVLLLFCISLTAICFFQLFPGAKHNIQSYLDTQLLASFQGKRITPHSGFGHFYIVIHFLRAYWLASLVVSALVVYVSYKKGISSLFKALDKKKMGFYLSLALLSSLPVGVSPRQLFHYIIPSAPFYVLFLMYASYPAWGEWMKLMRKNTHYLITATSVSLVCFFSSVVILVTQFGGYARHKAIIDDVARLIQQLPEGEIVDASFNVLSSGLVRAYLSRDSLMSVSQGKTHRYYLSLKREAMPLNEYEPVPLETSFISVWQKKIKSL